jgi:hypothetical protein
MRRFTHQPVLDQSCIGIKRSLHSGLPFAQIAQLRPSVQVDTDELTTRAYLLDHLCRRAEFSKI